MLPPEAPLAMPVQSLTNFARAERRAWCAPRLAGAPWAARLYVFGGALLLTLYAAWQMYRVVEVGEVTSLEWLLVILFVANFSWIALAFTSGVLGFFCVVVRQLVGAEVDRADLADHPLVEVAISELAAHELVGLLVVVDQHFMVCQIELGDFAAKFGRGNSCRKGCHRLAKKDYRKKELDLSLDKIIFGECPVVEQV